MRVIFVQNSTFIIIDFLNFLNFLNFSLFRPINRKIFFSRLRLRLRLTNRLGNQRINRLLIAPIIHL